MMKRDLAKSKGVRRLVLPRWAVPFVWAAIVLVIHVLAPWAIAKLGPRVGWTGAAPGGWNLIGLIPVAIGLALYAWCLAWHFRSYASSVDIGVTPPHLVVAGPYKYSRNPMYSSALLAWFGWVIYYGSPAMLIALGLLGSAFAFRVIPSEERQLQGAFGDEYLEYMRSVHRWIGRA